MNQKKNSEAAAKQQINFLKKISFFHNFDDHELKQLLSVSRWLKAPPGTLLIKENSLEKVFYILVKGNVSVFITAEDGKHIKLTNLKTGDTFGEMAVVSETKRTAAVETTSECFILMVEPDILNQASVFLQLKFYRRFCEILVSRLIAANKKMTTLSSDQRKAINSDPKAVAATNSPSNSDPRPTKISVNNTANNVNTSDLPPIPPLQPVAKAKIRARIQQNLDLAVNPAVAARLSSFLVGSCDDTRQFSDLISCDPVLSAKVVQHANSTFYRRTSTISSVPHAIITMGIKDLQTVVAKETISIVKEEKVFGGFSQLTTSFWLHSVMVGRIASLLKETIRVNIQEDVHLAGLLHDIGQLALDQQQPLFYPQLLRPGFVEKNISDAEITHIGIDHGQAGAWVGEKMGLPKPYLDVMQHHHQPEKAGENALLVALIHLANLFAKQRGSTLCNYEPDLPPLYSSFGWTVIQEHHQPFIDVNLENFIELFNEELDRSWKSISSLTPL